MTAPIASPDPSAGALQTNKATHNWPLLDQLVAAGREAIASDDLPSARGRRVVCLARRSRDQPSAALGLLGELGPELASICRRLVRHRIEDDEAEALTVAVAWEVITGRRGHRRPRTSAELTGAIWNEVRRDGGLRRRRLDTVELRPDIDAPTSEADHLERWPGLLAAAVAARVLNPRQVVIVAQSRMDERPLVEVARTLGRPYDAVRMERQRAEKTLRDFALSYDWSSS